MNALFLEPHDVLYLRGNKLFGDAGAHGEALMPPWPSMAAGYYPTSDMRKTQQTQLPILPLWQMQKDKISPQPPKTAPLPMDMIMAAAMM